MLGKIKLYATIVLSFLVVIFYALFNREKAAHANNKLKGEIRARKTGQKVSKAMMDRLKKEEIERAKIMVSGRKRDGFD